MAIIHTNTARITLMKVLFIILLSTLVAEAPAQRSLGSILNSLNNKDVYVSFITHASCIWTKAPDTTLNKDSALAGIRFFKVVSLDEDINEVARRFERKMVIEQLYRLLEDPAKDFYANVLLYDLLDNHKLGKFLFNRTSRESWIDSGEKIKDVKKWQSFIKDECSFLPVLYN
jgi:hypothetical protein